MAVTGAGQTLYELACTGCPAVAIEMVPNQTGQLEELIRAGSVRRGGRAGQMDGFRELREALLPLLSDRQIRQAMSEAGRRLVDGKGALRVARALLSMAEGSGSGAGGRQASVSHGGG